MILICIELEYKSIAPQMYRNIACRSYVSLIKVTHEKVVIKKFDEKDMDNIFLIFLELEGTLVNFIICYVKLKSNMYKLNIKERDNMNLTEIKSHSWAKTLLRVFGGTNLSSYLHCRSAGNLFDNFKIRCLWITTGTGPEKNMLKYIRP